MISGSMIGKYQEEEEKEGKEESAEEEEKEEKEIGGILIKFDPKEEKYWYSSPLRIMDYVPNITDRQHVAIGAGNLPGIVQTAWCSTRPPSVPESPEGAEFVSLLQSADPWLRSGCFWRRSAPTLVWTPVGVNMVMKQLVMGLDTCRCEHGHKTFSHVF